MNLTISGLHGTGKSTIGNLVAEILKLKYYSTGQAFRDLAKERDMTLEEFTKYVEDHSEIDQDLDDKIISIAKQGNVIIDSQLGGFFLEKFVDFKIFLTCPIENRVKRMTERDNTSYEEKLKETKLREQSELERFRKLYNIDLSDEKRLKELYDIIIDTQNLTIEEVVSTIINTIKEKNSKINN
ncbi:MAG: (d)CMP kinase [Promethearchaeota archaeon]